ncbi:CRAL/TRIO domain-containing protein [Hyaloscypha variabilis F]|uniref:CRAL/TRIO domain-containing protein n=1 Tax=Hyaloscypha variabilis (strain UAMH 11265 / GT02V1 / F) TaxID=1149755 RepID=A0A2J6QWR1_HYAVF|nr:CRAL/TRIO domain-containing protein [Hyaloscypha variabilis F]
MSSDGPAHRVQSAVVEYGYPQGHLGHLSPDEEAAFKNFKIVCEEKGVYKPGTDDEPGTHDDATLLRFLRARRFVVADALTQFTDTEKWRKANQLDQLYETIDIEHYDETRRLYPQWTGRRDRRGIPVYVYEVKHLNSKTMAAYEKSAKETNSKAQTDGKTSPKLLRLFALYENLIRFVMPLCTALMDRDHPRTPITQSNNIVDISGVGLKQFWNLRTHMQDASTLATAHYPETLDRIFIIGAPAFFPTVWGWIKRWFDPITTSKIFILSHHDLLPTLESFIDPANIPKKYGGQLDYTFGDKPVPDPAMEKYISWEGERKEFPRGPMYWVNSNGDGKGKAGKEGFDMEALAVGAEGGKERREKVCRIATQFPVSATDTVTNGHANPLLKEMLTAPTEVDLPSTIQASSLQQEPSKPAEAEVAVQEGTLIPASRPEPVTFVTAAEGIETLNEKTDTLALNGEAKGPHQTKTANLLDPSVAVNGNAVGTEDAHQHVEKGQKAVGGGVEEADRAHGGLERVKENITVSA